MKIVTAIIKPFKLEEVKLALQAAGPRSTTVTETKGFGRQMGHAEIYRGCDYGVDFMPKVKIKIVLRDDCADQAVDAIGRAARTGHIGDGKRFVSPIERVVGIRTGKTDDEAL